MIHNNNDGGDIQENGRIKEEDERLKEGFGILLIFFEMEEIFFNIDIGIGKGMRMRNDGEV
jgi:hypothetical protein